MRSIAMTKERLAGKRVLVVEDEHLIAAALAVVNGGEAIDAAVLDVNLRGEPSYGVADALAGRDTPFLFTTGYDAATLPSCYSGSPHLEKPVEPVANIALLE